MGADAPAAAAADFRGESISGSSLEGLLRGRQTPRGRPFFSACRHPYSRPLLGEKPDSSGAESLYAGGKMSKEAANTTKRAARKRRAKPITTRVNPQDLSEDEADALYMAMHRGEKSYPMDEVFARLGLAVERSNS